MAHSIDQTLHQFANLLPNWTFLPSLTFLSNFGGFHRTLQRMRLANRGRLLLRMPGPVPFGTCICSNVETILSWTCHVYGPFEFRTFLGTSILLYLISLFIQCTGTLHRVDRNLFTDMPGLVSVSFPLQTKFRRGSRIWHVDKMYLIFQNCTIFT